MTLAIDIRTEKHPLSGRIRRAAKRLLSMHLPVGALTKRLFGLLYRLHVVARESKIWALRFFWYEPLFRSQCESVGRRFRMEALPYITGRGRIVVGAGVRLSGKSSFGFGNRFRSDPRITIGDDTFIGHGCCFAIADSITIGSHCLIAAAVSVRDLDGHPTDAAERRANHPTPPQGIRPVTIEDDVWIGAGATILKGVTIGARSIVGANAVVVRDVPPDTVVAGNPARLVKQLLRGEPAE
jgi:acetyltransferase-like isoleucine patch superfamily enzyme